MCKALLEEQARVNVYDPQVKRSQMFVEFDYTCGVNKDNTPKLEESVSDVPRAFARPGGRFRFSFPSLASCACSGTADVV